MASGTCSALALMPGSMHGVEALPGGAPIPRRVHRLSRRPGGDMRAVVARAGGVRVIRNPRRSPRPTLRSRVRQRAAVRRTHARDQHLVAVDLELVGRPEHPRVSDAGHVHPQLCVVVLLVTQELTAVSVSTLNATQRSPGFGVAVLLPPSARERLRGLAHCRTVGDGKVANTSGAARKKNAW